VSDDWAAVAHVIDERMTELGLSQRELAERSQVSLAIVREIRHHTVERRRSPRTLESLSVALGWQPDHLHAVLSRQVALTTPEPADDTAESLSARIAALEGKMSEAIELLYTMQTNLETLIKYVRPDR
jgi:transcriptional regulator with XRE-family HTH domain